MFEFLKPKKKVNDITEQLENARRGLGSVAVLKLEKMDDDTFKLFVETVDENNLSEREIYDNFLNAVDDEMRKVVGCVIDEDIIDKHYDQVNDTDLELGDSMSQFFAEVVQEPDPEMYELFITKYNERRGK